MRPRRTGSVHGRAQIQRQADHRLISRIAGCFVPRRLSNNLGQSLGAEPCSLACRRVVSGRVARRRYGEPSGGARVQPIPVTGRRRRAEAEWPH